MNLVPRPHPGLLDGSHPGLVSVADGKTVTGVSGTLVPAARISGTVTTGSATPVADICVTVASTSGGGWIGFATTDSRGGYSMAGIPGGHYVVGFSGGCGNAGSYAPQYYSGEATQAGADLVLAVDGTTTKNINAIMQPGGTITGTVTNYSGARLSRICVMVASPGALGGVGPSPLGASAVALLFTGLARTGVNGGYRVANLGLARWASPVQGAATR